MWKDAKYLIAYVAPLSAYLGIYLGGIWSFGSLYIGFGLIPLFELWLPGSTHNLTPAQEQRQARRRLFDWLLYLNLPILWGLVFYYLYTLQHRPLETYEVIGMTLNVGLIVGTIGINVGHELGHRTKRYEQLIAQALLLSALYMHFFIEHNRGHHKHVATALDPASAPAGLSIYAFWWRSVSGGYRNAWQLETTRLQRAGLSFWSLHNQMLVFQLVQLAYLGIAFWLFGPMGAVAVIAVAVVGFLLLESVNYIEHYGLRRRLLPNGRYEPVRPEHSWNSNHELGRIFLYELTRHSDHHYKASRKYQTLRHFEESPQLPTGYPGAILVALLPPLWYRMMHPRLAGWEGAG